MWNATGDCWRPVPAPVVHTPGNYMWRERERLKESHGLDSSSQTSAGVSGTFGAVGRWGEWICYWASEPESAVSTWELLNPSFLPLSLETRSCSFWIFSRWRSLFSPHLIWLEWVLWKHFTSGATANVAGCSTVYQWMTLNVALVTEGGGIFPVILQKTWTDNRHMYGWIVERS